MCSITLGRRGSGYDVLYQEGVAAEQHGEPDQPLQLIGHISNCVVPASMTRLMMPFERISCAPDCGVLDGSDRSCMCPRLLQPSLSQYDSMNSLKARGVPDFLAAILQPYYPPPLHNTHSPISSYANEVMTVLMQWHKCSRLTTTAAFPLQC